MRMIGRSHHFFRTFMNAQSSPTKLDRALLTEALSLELMTHAVLASFRRRPPADPEAAAHEPMLQGIAAK
jgi:hypothetical protein